MDKIKWAIIGTGKIAHTFAAALKGCGDAVLEAVASRKEEKARRFAEEFGFAESYGSYGELAQKSSADVVYIATPMASHYGDAKLCLEAGKNVLCEKSVTMNCTELEELLAIAREKNLFFMEAMWTKCRPAYLKAKEWITSGRIGELRYIRADFCNIVHYDPNDRLFRADCGGGAILDLGVYPITLAEDFMGEPEQIISSAHIGREGIDLSNSIILRRGNAFASIESGFEQPSRNNALISGTKGSVILGDWFFCTCEATLYDRDENEAEKFTHENLVNGYEYEIFEVNRCLREGLLESPLVPHSGTLSVMRIMDECRRQF